MYSACSLQCLTTNVYKYLLQLSMTFVEGSTPKAYCVHTPISLYTSLKVKIDVVVLSACCHAEHLPHHMCSVSFSFEGMLFFKFLLEIKVI